MYCKADHAKAGHAYGWVIDNGRTYYYDSRTDSYTRPPRFVKWVAEGQIGR